MSQTGTSKIMSPNVLFLFINGFSRLIISALILKGHQRWQESKLQLARKISHYLFLPQRSHTVQEGFELATLARVTLDFSFSYTQMVGLQACTFTLVHVEFEIEPRVVCILGKYPSLKIWRKSFCPLHSLCRLEPLSARLHLPSSISWTVASFSIPIASIAPSPRL